MRLTYFDNAATSFPKPASVIKAVRRCLSGYCANPGRSTHAMAVRAAEEVYATRELVAEFLGFSSPERIVFTSNATHALNTAIKGLIDHKCHVIASDMEHNSVIRPLATLADTYGVEISYYNSDLPLRDAIAPLIRKDTEFIVTSIASNVTGKVIDVRELSDIARGHGLMTIVDASQYLGHLPLDLSLTPLDVVCAPAHKGLFGIQGGGFALFNTKRQVRTLMEGGGGGDTFNQAMPMMLPERLEAGTLNLPSIVALGAGIKYIKGRGSQAISERISRFSDKLGDILSNVGATVYGCCNGIASFEMRGLGSGTLATLLDSNGIATRSGLHCAPMLHKKLGTEDRGLVRVSLSDLNTEHQLDRLYRVLKKCK